ncbi:MAG: YIP1 family protein, partial [Firmicutes bacterium]|nr:YIP1 family protein [Bacillota bacterium]
SQGYYEESMIHFELAGSRYLYSQAFWEVRNANLQSNLPFTLLSIILLTIGYYVVKLTNKKYLYLNKPKAAINKFIHIKFVNDILYMFNLIRHPIDSFYYLKRNKKGSYLGATIIFGLFFLSYMISVTSKGFIYQFVEAADLDLTAIILGFFSLSGLFIICNYLVASINDGEGSLGEIYKGVMYSTLPVMSAYLITTFLSYYFTYNEVFILQLIMYVGIGWSGLLIFIAVQELHNYTIRESIKSFLLTALFMMIAAVLLAFIQIMGDQLLQFVIAVVKEAIRNVFN